jgi:hypothetical protein
MQMHSSKPVQAPPVRSTTALASARPDATGLGEVEARANAGPHAASLAELARLVAHRQSMSAPVQRVVVVPGHAPLADPETITRLAVDAGASPGEAEVLAMMSPEDVFEEFGSWQEAIQAARRRLGGNNNSGSSSNNGSSSSSVPLLGGSGERQPGADLGGPSRLGAPLPGRYEELCATAGLGEEWSTVLSRAAGEAAGRLDPEEGERVLRKVITFLKEVTPVVGERIGAFRPVTQESVKKRIGDEVQKIVEGGEGAYAPQEFGNTSDQEMIAQQLLRARAGKDPAAFTKLLAKAEPRIQEKANGLRLEYELGDIPLGEVTLVITGQDTVELHFNVEEPLKYIGVATELWNRGLQELERAYPPLLKANVILPAFSNASRLMVTRQLAQLGGDAVDFVRGSRAGQARKAQRDVVSSANEQHERFRRGGQDTDTSAEMGHYLSSVAKSLYTHENGIVGYLNPWTLLNAYAVNPNSLAPEAREAMGKAIGEAMMANRSTLEGQVEVAEAHRIVDLPYDAARFVPAVVSGAIPLMLGARGQSLVDFSLRRATLKTIGRAARLKLAEKTT